MHQTIENILNELRRNRLDKGLSLTALADELGVSYNSLQAWESGRYKPKLNEFCLWCDYFGIETI